MKCRCLNPVLVIMITLIAKEINLLRLIDMCDLLVKCQEKYPFLKGNNKGRKMGCLQQC